MDYQSMAAVARTNKKTIYKQVYQKKHVISPIPAPAGIFFIATHPNKQKRIRVFVLSGAGVRFLWGIAQVELRLLAMTKKYDFFFSKTRCIYKF